MERDKKKAENMAMREGSRVQSNDYVNETKLEQTFVTACDCKQIRAD